MHATVKHDLSAVFVHEQCTKHVYIHGYIIYTYTCRVCVEQVKINNYAGIT